ncbi:MAG: sec-independent protein translocase protein TatA [Ilumatobacter sp.]|jgi:sec-independent protein translocase protein TatA
MLGGPEGMVLLVLVLVLFGGAQLPKLARNLGRAQKEFKDGLADATHSDSEPVATEVPEAVATEATEPVPQAVSEPS